MAIISFQCQVQYTLVSYTRTNYICFAGAAHVFQWLIGRGGLVTNLTQEFYRIDSYSSTFIMLKLFFLGVHASWKDMGCDLYASRYVNFNSRLVQK